MPCSCVEGELPERKEVQPAGLRLDVVPVTADIENVDERQSGDIFDMLCNRFAVLTRSDGWTVLFPDVTNQTEAGVSNRFLRRAAEINRSPPFILIDVEGALIEAIGYSRRGIL